jgi:biopolymer transport protein ExbB
MIAWALLGCSGTALTVALERGAFWLRRRWNRDPNAVTAILECVKTGALAEAMARARGSRDSIVRILGVALDLDGTDLTREVELAARADIERARRGIGILETIVEIAPLLGILGTIVGVLDVFESIGSAGIRNASEMEGVMRGIGKALITTAAGLVIAIPTFIVHNGLLSLVRRHALAIESAATRLEQSTEGARAAR